jgi:chemotaxis protein methyltransferase WspC
MNFTGIELAVRQRLGIDAESLGTAVLPRAIDLRLRARGVTTPEAYLGLLAAEPDEAEALVAELVVGETWFFRGGRPLFDRLAEFVGNRAATRTPDQPVRVLSVPCSTGEEPYSLAIALHERMAQPERYVIDAVDVSPRHLERAVAGRFTAFAFREAGIDIRPDYFRQHDARWELLPRLRHQVRFRAANVIDPAFLVDESPYDLILCRNLFIYLTPEARKQAMSALDRLLVIDGRLCLTPGEADRLPPNQFTADGPGEFGIYRRIGVGSAIHAVPAWAREASPASPPPAAGIPPQLQPPAPAPPPTRPAEEIQAPPFSLEQARQLANAGRLVDALAACERLLRDGPASANAYALLGAIRQARGDAAEAAEAFRRALYLDPDHPEALAHMSVICERRGDAPQAAALRRRLARLPRKEGT